MNEPSYRKALSHALHLVWHHKILWVLGLLSVFVGELGLSNFLGEIWAKFITPENSWWPQTWGAIHINNGWQLFWFVWLGAIVAAFLVFVIVASVCAESALIYASQHWYRLHLVPKLADAWHEGGKHFWGVLGVNLLEKILLGVIIAVVVAATPLYPAGLAGFIFTVLTFAVSAFLAFILSLIAIYSLGYIVADSLPVVEAVAKSWSLISRHLLVSLELTAILLFLNVLIAWFISLGSVVVLIPSFVMSIVGGASGINSLVSFAVGLYMILFALFVILLGAFFNTFTTSAWMYMFMKMHHEGVSSRLAHYAKRFFGKE